jgi:hypothetical protein
MITHRVAIATMALTLAGIYWMQRVHKVHQ